MILSVILSAIFIVLGMIHVYWVIGGTLGLEKSLPTKENGERVLNPKKLDTALVGIGLIIFGVFYMVKSGLISYNPPAWIMDYGSWIIPSIFILRAVGEFKYVGFFKSVKNTGFGKLDTRFFSPLCLTIGVFGIIANL